MLVSSVSGEVLTRSCNNLLHVLWRIVSSNGDVLAERARWLKTGRDRRRGLLGSRELRDGEGVVLERAFQVHTFGMAYPIDVVFCSRNWEVLSVVDSMPPHRLGRVVLRGFYAIEVPAGSARVQRGDRLELTAIDWWPEH
jgi:uncharacterized membrane protein (UPF0127 family)